MPSRRHTTRPLAAARPGRVRPAGGRRLVIGLAALAVLATACSSGSTSSSTSTTGAKAATSTTAAGGLPPIKHVFVIMLENEGYSDTFGSPSSDPYLATTLPSEGALLQNYYGIGHHSNDNYVAFVSGQAPNPDNQADCLIYADFPPSATIG